ncbi:MAG: hypothetical protein AAF502_24385 [Bacteroidota bacterium]
MKNFKLFSLFALVSLVLFATGCKEDAVVNQIVITIEEPVDGEAIAIADCADVHVHVDFVASVENHEVEIILHPEGDVNDRIIDYDEHMHDQVIVFEQEVDLCSYGAGACFHLEVVACVDHDCTERATAEAEFCLQ